MTDSAAASQHYQALAKQAANNLADEWIAHMTDLMTLSTALATCEAAPVGLRDLARRQINTLQVTASAASAITSRREALQQVSIRRSGPPVPVPLRRTP